LTAYILFRESHNTLNVGSVASNTTDRLGSNDRYVTSGMNDSKALSQQNDPGLDYLWHSAPGLREVFQLIMLRKANLLSAEKWLMILRIFTSFMLNSGVVESMEIRHHFSAFAILLGWFDLFLMSGRLQQLSLKLEILKTVRLTS
jgi:hypothetical protein